VSRVGITDRYLCGAGKDCEMVSGNSFGDAKFVIPPQGLIEEEQPQPAPGFRYSTQVDGKCPTALG